MDTVIVRRWSDCSEIIDIKLGAAAGSTAQNWLFGSAGELTGFTNDIVFDVVHDGSESPGLPQSQVAFPRVYYSTQTFRKSTAGGPVTAVVPAMVVVNEDDSINRYGWLAGAGSTVTVDGDTSTVSGTRNAGAPFALDDATSFSFDTDSDAFSGFSADLSPSSTQSDRACWNDRRTMITLIGDSFGSATYTPRGDFDLDLDIDATDWAAYVAFFNTEACVGDFNCSGTVDLADLQDFNDLWGTQNGASGTALEADYNANGTVDLSDLLDFFDAWTSGC